MKLISQDIQLMVAALALCSVTTSIQAASALIGYEGAGENKAAMCVDCHGIDGNSDNPNYPRLAGQYAGYIVKQVKDFKKGHRPTDDAIAAMINSEDDIRDIGAYFSQQKMKGSLTKPNQDLLASGEKLYREGNAKSGIYGCINCHGEKGKGMAENVSTFPVIGGQHRDYLVKQLKEYRDGVRPNDPAGMMTGVAKKLSDKEIEAVAEYLAAQI